MIRVEFHPAAETELEDIYNWYSERSQIAARALVSEVAQAISALLLPLNLASKPAKTNGALFCQDFRTL